MLVKDEEPEADLLKTLVRWFLIFILGTTLYGFFTDWLYQNRVFLTILGVVALVIYILIKIRRNRNRFHRDDY